MRTIQDWKRSPFAYRLKTIYFFDGKIHYKIENGNVVAWGIIPDFVEGDAIDTRDVLYYYLN